MESPLPEGVWCATDSLRVIDGDTFACRVDVPGLGWYPTHVRLADINAPERRHPTLAAGDRSKLALVAMLGGGPVYVMGVGTDLDRYGRVIAHVSAPVMGGTPHVEELLVSGHYAVPFSP